MNKIYLLYGDEKYFIDQYLNDLLSKNKDYDLVEYDALDTKIDDVIDDLNTVSLFSTNKLVICRNCYFLTGVKSDIEHNIDKLIDYIKEDSDNILVLTVNEDSIDKRKKIVKELEKSSTIKIFNKLKENELNNFVIKYCDNNGYKIENDALKLFLELVNDNLYIITNELDKMFLYKDKNKIIKKEDVVSGTSKVINSNIFDLIDAIVKRNIDRALSLYDDLLLLNEEEIKLIIILANQFRLIYQVKEMFRSGYSELDISKILGVHPYRIKLAKDVDVNSKECLEFIKKLSELDKNIKTGIIDKEIGFEKFILEL